MKVVFERANRILAAPLGTGPRGLLILAALLLSLAYFAPLWKLTMLEPRKVKLAPRYFYRGQEGTAVRAQLELVNDDANGLGVPLPAGRVCVFEADAQGDLQFTGEPTIAHTPSGEKLTLDIGTAFDVVGERRETDNKRISDRER